MKDKIQNILTIIDQEQDCYEYGGGEDSEGRLENGSVDFDRIINAVKELENTHTSSSTKTISAEDICICGHTRGEHTKDGCDNRCELGCPCSQFKSKTKSEGLE